MPTDPVLRRVLVVGDPGDSDAGHVGERLAQHGARLDLLLRPLTERPALAGVDLVLLLGSEHAVHDPARAQVVQTESELVRDAVRSGVPVMGLCYGAQLAAHALGGSVRRAERGEVGWYDVTPQGGGPDAELCPPGPWLQFHDDVLTPPPGARLLGTSPVGPQCFLVEPAGGTGGVVGWQFHPETMPATLERWLGQDADAVARRGVDAVEVLRMAQQGSTAYRAAAHRLVDVALARLLP